MTLAPFRCLWPCPIVGKWLLLILLAAAPVLLPPAAQAQDVALSRAGQPDVWTITGIRRGERLALRMLPGTMFDATGTVELDEQVQNFGCAEVFGARWCKVGKQTGNRAQGFVRSRNLTDRALRPTPDDSLAGGPDYWQVAGLKQGERLGIRADATSEARVLATLRNGEHVRNLGCTMVRTGRWCKVQAPGGSRVSGFVDARYLIEAGGTPPSRPRPPTGDDLTGGPDFWRVQGLPRGDTLNIRQAPTTRSKVIGTLREGDRVRNLGCQMTGQTRWCLIRSTTGTDVTGYAAGRYLRE
ncbi:MAG: SH3 domain-containing protein [Paracoccaceae bacterium]